MYTEYITNFDNALKVLDESCKKYKAFEELVREFEVYIYLLHRHTCGQGLIILAYIESADLCQPATQWLLVGDCTENSTIQAALTRSVNMLGISIITNT